MKRSFCHSSTSQTDSASKKKDDLLEKVEDFATETNLLIIFFAEKVN